MFLLQEESPEENGEVDGKRIEEKKPPFRNNEEARINSIEKKNKKKQMLKANSSE